MCRLWNYGDKRLTETYCAVYLQGKQKDQAGKIQQIDRMILPTSALNLPDTSDIRLLLGYADKNLIYMGSL